MIAQINNPQLVIEVIVHIHNPRLDNFIRKVAFYCKTIFTGMLFVFALKSLKIAKESECFAEKLCFSTTAIIIAYYALKLIPSVRRFL